MGGASKSALLISDYWLFILGGCSPCDGIGRAAGAIHDKLGRHLVCTLVGKLEIVESGINIFIYHVDPLVICLTDIHSAPEQTENLFFNVGGYNGFAENSFSSSKAIGYCQLT